jgi:hypothetical protein
VIHQIKSAYGYTHTHTHTHAYIHSHHIHSARSDLHYSTARYRLTTPGTSGTLQGGHDMFAGLTVFYVLCFVIGEGQDDDKFGI